MKQLLKSLLFSSLVICNCNTSKAQYLSLVPDCSLEDTTSDWQNWTGSNCLSTWSSLANFAFCAEFLYCSINRINDLSIVGLPQSAFWQQYPRHGLGASMIVNYQDCNTSPIPCPPPTRSVMRNKLKQKLKQGSQYCATLYVVADELSANVYYTNGLAMYFDNGQLDTVYTKHKDSLGVYTFVQPQVQCPFVINDTANWMKLQGTFIANGAEEYITIGNFLEDSALLTSPVPPKSIPSNFRWQQVLIDDVSLIPTDISNWLPNAYATAGDDSVWVGLDKFDYPDGKWFTATGTYITTGPGFWQKPVEAGAKFIQEIDICGVKKYDTLEVVVTPLGIPTLNKYGISLVPNPNKGSFIITTASFNNEVMVSDITGKLLYKNKFKSKEFALDLKGPSGIYFVQVRNELGEFRQKVLMEN
jgi:hypothetical protein